MQQGNVAGTNSIAGIAQVLRDLPAQAQADLAALGAAEAIAAYQPAWPVIP